jgi:hypothetical protein
MPIVKMDEGNGENSIIILVGIYLCYDETSLIDYPNSPSCAGEETRSGTKAKKGYIRLVGGIVE